MKAEIEVEKVLDTIRGCWSRETSITPLLWTKENPDVGQSIPTSLLARDIFGGELYTTMIHERDNIYPHCFVVSYDIIIDMCRESYGTWAKMTFPDAVTPDFVLDNKDVKKAYEVLRKNFVEKYQNG